MAGAEWKKHTLGKILQGSFQNLPINSKKAFHVASAALYTNIEVMQRPYILSD